MKLSLRREWMEYALLILTLGILLWLGPGSIWAHRIDHGYPYAYNAADAFQHQARAQGILRIGDYEYEPMERISGVFAAFPGYYPPTVSQLGALWAAIPGLETYHTTPALVFLSVLMSGALMYFIIRRFNAIMALLSLPLFLYLFSTPVAMRYFTWGNWPGIFGQIFLFLFAWTVLDRDMPGWILFILVALTGTFMAYTSYVIPIGILLLAALGLMAWGGKLKPARIVMLALAFPVFLLAVSRFAIIFLNVWGPLMEEQAVLTDWPGGGGAPVFAELGAIRWLVVGGAVFSVAILYQHLRRKRVTKSLIIIFSLLMFGLGYANAIGFHKRAFFVRLLWPLYLSVFLGILLYHAGAALLRQSGRRWSLALAAGVTSLLLLAVALTVQRPDAGQGTLDRQLWEGITWLRDTTPDNATLAIMYGDVFVGDLLWNVQRHHLLIDKEGYVEALRNNSVKRYMLSTIGTNWYPFTTIPEDLRKENPVFWGWKWDDSLPRKTLWQERDICAWEYILFTKQSYQPVLAQYGLYIASLLQEKEWIGRAFENDRVVILHNTRTGDACIEDQQIQQQ